MLEWLEDKLNLGCALQFMKEKDVRLSFRIANLLLADEIRLLYVCSLHNIKGTAIDKGARHIDRVHCRKAYNDLIELMMKHPEKLTKEECK